MNMTPLTPADIAAMKQQHPALFSQQRRYLWRVGLMAAAVLLYYLAFLAF
ncbi:phosphonate ABC transporter, permease protein PhnE, partial [Dickeya dadantii]|nr:phosphonate ABC transporter, permease protein PhnE [Dickeya dadantii]